MTTLTAVDIRGAFLLLERHRATGPAQAPLCKSCKLPWPCRPRISAGHIILSVLADSFGCLTEPPPDLP